MNRVIAGSLCLAATVTMVGCSAAKPTATQNAKTESAPQSKPPSEPGALQVGQASGSYTAKGEVVELKYAYAGRGQRFGSDAMIVLVTDKPVPPESVAEEIKSQTLLLSEKIRGLEYVIDKDGLWVRYHPGQYQESTNKQLKEYTVEGDVVRGVDEDPGDLSDGKYRRSVKFVAAVVK